VGAGWPRVDRSLAIFKGTRFEDGASIGRDEIERAMFLHDKKLEALLKWWDDTRAEMDRRGIETGYRRCPITMALTVAINGLRMTWHRHAGGPFRPEDRAPPHHG
jgi:hypothetical protein